MKLLINISRLWNLGIEVLLTQLIFCQDGTESCNVDKQQRMRVPKNLFHNQQKDNTVGLFDMIHSKFTRLGHGYHGAPIHHFQYHMDDAKWTSIEPIIMGKVVVSNTCPEFLHKGDRCPQQGKRLDVSKTTTASNTWMDSNAMAHNGGFELTFNAGVPFLIFDGSGTNKWGITKSSNHAIGRTESKQKRWSVSDSCKAAAGQVVTCKFCTIKIQIQVPFTATRADGQELHGQFYGNDFVYGGLSVSYENLWASNRSGFTSNDICSVGGNENHYDNNRQP